MMFHTTLRCGKLDKIGLLERDRSPIGVPKTAAMASVTTPQKKSRAGYRQSPCPNGERAVFTAPESTGSRHKGTRTSHSHLCITRKKWKKQCHASRIPASVPATSRSAGHSLTYLVGKEFPSLSLSLLLRSNLARLRERSKKRSAAGASVLLRSAILPFPNVRRSVRMHVQAFFFFHSPNGTDQPRYLCGLAYLLSLQEISQKWRQSSLYLKKRLYYITDSDIRSENCRLRR